MKVTFCGHGDINYGSEIREKLAKITEQLIEKGANEFLLDGYGDFDLMAAHTVRRLKEKYPHISPVLVIPYMDQGYDKELYDRSEYPPIETVPKRLAIIKRNEWMADKSDVVAAYVSHDYGGAARTLHYAIRRKKFIICLNSK